MIIIPMAGNSSRFYQAGYTRPKYELPVGEESLFALCVRSFERYFQQDRFVFVCRQDMQAEAFVDRECARLGIKDYMTVPLKGVSRGQAESVLLGIRGAGAHPAESLLIFNIDTVRPDYAFPAVADMSDGYLEVFSGAGEHWSFVRPAAGFSNRVAETTEKKRISNLCCTGLYHFARCSDYIGLCEEAIGNVDEYRRQWGELYIAPLYNSLIRAGGCVTYHEVAREDVLFSGTPDEYAALVQDASR